MKKISIKKLAEIVLNNNSKYDFNNIYTGKSEECFNVHVKIKNKKDQFKTIRIHFKETKEYKCTDCKHLNYLVDNGRIRTGLCEKCGHPLWN